MSCLPNRSLSCPCPPCLSFSLRPSSLNRSRLLLPSIRSLHHLSPTLLQHPPPLHNACSIRRHCHRQPRPIGRHPCGTYFFPSHLRQMPCYDCIRGSEQDVTEEAKAGYDLASNTITTYLRLPHDIPTEQTHKLAEISTKHARSIRVIAYHLCERTRKSLMRSTTLFTCPFSSPSQPFSIVHHTFSLAGDPSVGKWKHRPAT